MSDLVLFKNRRPNRPATFDEYRRSGGYESLMSIVGKKTPAEVCRMVKDAGLRGRGGAGFPTGIKWGSIHEDSPHPRYLLPNTDEMEPGTFKDRVLVRTDPHLVIEGIIIAGYAITAERAIFFIRPSYDADAVLIEEELRIAREAGFLGKNILGTDFSFEIMVHRSAGRYICGEASAQVQAIEGHRAHPLSKPGQHLTDHGLYGKPTVVNNVETLSNVPHILRHDPDWYKKLAKNEDGAGTKLYCVSGRVRNPGCFEFPIGTPAREIIEEGAGGMALGSQCKAFLPGGASTSYLPAAFLDVEMDFEPLKKVGNRLGTGAIVVIDQNTCMVAATRNLIEFFARESCGWCTPCREGLPFVLDLLTRIENGEGKEEYIGMLKKACEDMKQSYCAFAPGAAEPVKGLLKYFEGEIREHLSQKGCPFRKG